MLLTGKDEKSIKWRSRFADMARLVATWSKDPSTQVGAVIFDARRIVVGVGYNGFPRGVKDDVERYNIKDVKYRLVVHAEANAIMNASKSVRECALLVTKYPCSECSKLIAQSGIMNLFCPEPSTDEPWASDAGFSEMILSEAGVEINRI